MSFQRWGIINKHKLILYFQTKEEEEVFNKQRSKKAQKKYEERKKTAKVEQAVEDQFQTSKIWGECEDIVKCNKHPVIYLVSDSDVGLGSVCLAVYPYCECSFSWVCWLW